MNSNNHNGISPLVLILLTIIMCTVGLGVFLLNHEILSSFDPSKAETAYQQNTAVHTAMVVREAMKPVSNSTVEGMLEPGMSDDDFNDELESTDDFAAVDGQTIAYNWQAKVNINSRGVVDNPGAYNGMTREFGVDKYKSYNFTSNTRQNALHSKIAAAVTNNGGYAMYDGYLLMVAPLSLDGPDNWVGCKGALTDSHGNTVKVIFVDAKGNLAGDDVVVNANETVGVDLVKGHFIGGHIDVIEVEADKGTSRTTFQATFGLDLSTSSPAKGYHKGDSLL